MRMHNPVHPGEFIRSVYMEPLGLTAAEIAEHINVSPSTVSRLLNGRIDVTPEMSIRLSKSLGRSPESWLSMQNSFDLSRQMKVKGVFAQVKPIRAVSQATSTGQLKKRA